ncbi:MAG TPA: proteasome subunit beta [archaeon]|nr:proteasome subunit beta [archaeon]
METYKTGTTTVAIVAKDSIVLAADMQATMGNLQSNNDMTKIYQINDHLAVTIAGSVGDALVLVRFLKVQASLFELEHKTPMNTKACATLLSNILNSNKMVPFFTQFILAGSVGGLSLYNLDIAGGIVEEKEFSYSGSGSELALSVLDSQYKKGLSTDDAIKLAKEAITAAKKRDIYTGGQGMKIVVIKKDKIEELPIAKY